MKGKYISIFGLALGLAMAGNAFGQETATGTIAATSLGGGQTKYDIALTNTGSVSIGTFWFSWIPLPNYDFMESAPTNITFPTGWIGFSTGLNNGTTDGNSVEMYNISGTADQIAPGATANFSFQSAETLAQINGPSSFYLHQNETTSFIYSGFPEGDAGFQLTLTPVSVPEPVSASVMALIGGGLLLRRQRQA